MTRETISYSDTRDISLEAITGTVCIEWLVSGPKTD